MHKLSTLLAALSLAVACGDDGDDHDDTNGSPEQAGAACHAPDDCYPDVDEGDLQGAAVCIDRVEGGYCSHECVTDDDCCAVEGECETDIHQVCSPFESTGMMMCFLSCEADDIDGEDAQAFCQDHVSPDWMCRSSGGGNQNRDICVPGECGVGEHCAADADCNGDLVCVTEVDGGYCTARDCGSDGDCPPDTHCVAHNDVNYCARSCTADSDCTYCREGAEATCTSDVEFVDGSTPGEVCIRND